MTADPYKLTLEQLVDMAHRHHYLLHDLQRVASSVGLPQDADPFTILSALSGILAMFRGGKPEAYQDAVDFELNIIAKRQVTE